MPSLFDGSPAQTSSGELWSATGYDFQFIDRKHLPFNSTIPPVHVEMIVADEKNYLPTHSVRLPPQTHEIQIDYTGLSVRIPERVRFRYRLSRHDKSWVDAGTRRQAFYNDLRPGHYLFEVICSNNDGVWNNEGAEVVSTCNRRGIKLCCFETSLFSLELSCHYRLLPETKSLCNQAKSQVR